MADYLKATYTNYRGETSERTLMPQHVWFGSTEWHPEPQWLLSAFDVDKQATRDFALKDFGYPAPVTAVIMADFTEEQMAELSKHASVPGAFVVAADPSPVSILGGPITPQMLRDTAAWCQSEEELRQTLKSAADALETTPSSSSEWPERLLAAAEEVLAGLHARIDAADKRAVPVFHGIVDLSDAIHLARAARKDSPSSSLGLPPMPATADRRPWDDEEPDGYLEGNLDWARDNDEALTWLIDNHKEIRAALTPTPTTRDGS